MTPAIPTAKLGAPAWKSPASVRHRTAQRPRRRSLGRVAELGTGLGINFVDTANDYGLHWTSPAEEQIGRHLSGRRSEFYLATKCGCPPGGGEHIWTRENAFRGLHESLDGCRRIT